MLAYAGLVFWLSEQAQAVVAPFLPFDFADKLAHAAEYGVFGLLLWRALGGASGGLRAALAATLLAGGYGAFDEWHQGWDPSKNRVPGVDDAVADLFGAAVASFAARAWSRRNSPGAAR